jgi:hypothetical protein
LAGETRLKAACPWLSVKRRGSFFEANDSLFMIVQFCFYACQTESNFVKAPIHLAAKIVEAFVSATTMKATSW